MKSPKSMGQSSKSLLLQDCLFIRSFTLVFSLSLFMTGFKPVAYSQTYTTTGNGSTSNINIKGNSHASGTFFKWSDPNNWSNGKVPASDGGKLKSGQVVNILHDVVYNRSDDLIIEDGATLNIERASLSTPISGTGSGRSFFVQTGGTLTMCNAELRLPIWNREDKKESKRTDLSGNFESYGTVSVYNSSIDIAQNWIGKGGSREFIGGCLRIGENFKIEGSIDTYIGTSISMGWQNSGNFDASSGKVFIEDSDIQLAGTSGNFNVNIVFTGLSGTVGSINKLYVVGNANISDSGDPTTPTWNVEVRNYAIVNGQKKCNSGGAFDGISDDTKSSSCSSCENDQFKKSLPGYPFVIENCGCGHKGDISSCKDDNCNLTASISSTPEECEGTDLGNMATISVEISSANESCGISGSGITYKLKDKDTKRTIESFGPTANTSHTFSNLDPGRYKVEVRDAAGCKEYEYITIESIECECPPIEIKE